RFVVDGTLTSERANLTLDGAITNVARLHDDASGRLLLEAALTGPGDAMSIAASARIPSGRVQDRALSEAAVSFDGVRTPGLLEGQVSGTAFLDGNRALLAANIRQTDETLALTGIEASTIGARVTGDVTRRATGLVDGRLVVDAPDISAMAALVLRDAAGRVTADVQLVARDGKQAADVRVEAANVRLETTRLRSADAQMALDDLFGVPRAEGTISAEGAVIAGMDVRGLDVEADTNGTRTAFIGSADLADGARLSTAGTLEALSPGYQLFLQTFDLTRGTLGVGLVEPAGITARDDRIALERLVLRVGEGLVSASGSVGDAFNISLDMDRVPLSAANAVRPDLALQGMIDGTAVISGPRDSPNVRFDLTGQRVGAAALSEAGIAPLEIAATGQSVADGVRLNSTIRSGNGIAFDANGIVPVGGERFALDIALTAFPLQVLNARLPDQDLAGQVTGTGKVTGTLTNPVATFDMRGTGVRARALTSAGLSPLAIGAVGRFADGIVTLTDATAAGAEGLTVAGAGAIPLSGPGLNVAANGTAPLSLANRALAGRGARVAGTLRFDMAATGSLAAPSLSGSFSTSGAEFVDPQANLRLTDITVDGGLARDQVTLRSASGRFAGGGTATASGTVGLGVGFPAALRVALRDVRYQDGTLLVATFSGDLNVTGSLVRDSLIAGEIRVARAEIGVPDTFGGGAEAISVRHLAPSPGVAATVRRAEGPARGDAPSPRARPSVARLDLTVRAPNQIFVRGRGLDAELGGQVRLTGPVTAIQPVGAFSLIRGRLSILGQRITFDEGTITLVGDLDPRLNFVARTRGSDIVVITTVTGRVSALEIAFTSEPELPEDEVLARLIFNRSLSELSPIQIARLAAAAAELAGGGNSSLSGSLRSATGLDDIDVGTDAEGNAVVRAGRYVNDNIYLGAETGADGRGAVTLDLDITNELKARGSLGNDGNSSLGVFFERDY
ncbi:MAG: translocation/assembly module TamB domain-containing protein, partial [Pseudomonadota bacterium]